jgi:hypothetical protein
VDAIRRSGSAIVLILSALILAARGTSEPRRAEALERDSAGGRIVENTGDAPPAIWTTGSEPTAEIGVEDGDSMELLF